MVLNRSCFPLCLAFLLGLTLAAHVSANCVFAEQKKTDSPSTNNKIIAKAKYPETVFNFGTVPGGTVVSHSFEFKNAGNTDYIIARIVSGCGCTAATPSGDTVAPGQSGFVKVDFDTTGFSGAKTKVVRVYSNDFDHPELTLTLNGTVQNDVDVSPSTVLFGEMVHGATVTPKEFSINIMKDSGVKISSVTSYSKFLKIEPILSSANASAASANKYKVSVDSSIPVGELRDRILINLNKGGTNSSVTLPVLGRVTGPIVLDPPQISYGIVEGQKILERTIKLVNRGASPVEITSISSDTNSVTPSFEIIEPGKNYLIHVKLDPTQVKSDVRALIEIKTSNDDVPALYLSVFGVTPPKLDF